MPICHVSININILRSYTKQALSGIDIKIDHGLMDEELVQHGRLVKFKALTMCQEAAHGFSYALLVRFYEPEIVSRIKAALQISPESVGQLLENDVKTLYEILLNQNYKIDFIPNQSSSEFTMVANWSDDEIISSLQQK